MVRIRPWRAGEEWALHTVYHSAIHGLAVRDYTPEQIEAWAPSTIDDALRERWVARIRAIAPYVAEVEGNIAGYADVQADGYIDHFFVAAAFSRQGVGSALMEHLHAVARTARLATMSSDVSRTAQPFFRRWGFVVVEERKPVVRGVEVPNARMEKRLA